MLLDRRKANRIVIIPDYIILNFNAINITIKPKVLHWNQIEPILSKIDVIEPMKQGFIDYSKGLAEIPPVGELIMEDPPGDVHIKYGLSLIHI